MTAGLHATTLKRPTAERNYAVSKALNVVKTRSVCRTSNIMLVAAQTAPMAILCVVPPAVSSLPSHSDPWGSVDESLTPSQRQGNMDPVERQHGGLGVLW